MAKDGKKIERDTIKNKNHCKICGKIIFDTDMQTTMCIKTRQGGNICLSCAYEIEETLTRAEFGYSEYYEDDDYEATSKPQNKSKVEIENIQEKIRKELPNKATVIRKMKKSIVGQDHAIERITGMVYRNIRSNNKEIKALPLLIGKSGQGKTEIATELCKLIKIPYVIVNAKDFSETGYTGRNPSEMFFDLYKKCDENLNLANYGVIIIDELDKLKETNDSERDVSGSGVVDTLLSYLSGIEVPIKDKHDTIIDYIDTTNIIFIFMGAFEDANKTLSLYKIRERRLGEKMIGFSNKTLGNEDKNIQRMFIAEDMMNYGFSRQFTGRVSMIELNELVRDDYMHLLLHSDISIYRAYKEEFLSHGLTLVCSKKLKESIVDKAMQKKTGVRGLKTVCEETFLTALEYVEDMKRHNYTRIIFGDNATENPLDYRLK